MRIDTIERVRPTTLVDAVLRGRAARLVRSIAADPAHGFAIEIVTDAAGLRRLESDWRDLRDRIGGLSFFASYEWTRSWWDHFGGDGASSLAVVTVRRHARLVAVAPLVIDCAGPYSWASFAGAGSGRYSGIAVDPAFADGEAVQAALWNGIRETRADTLIADNVPANGALAALLEPHWKVVGAWHRDYEVISGRYADFDDYLATRPARFAKTLRRRRLADEGPVRYEVVTGRAEIEEAVDGMLRLKHAWFAERGLHGRFLARPTVAAWLKDLCRCAGGRLHLSVLRVGGRIAAGQVAFIDGDRLTCYFAAFDIGYSRQSAGKLHLEDLLREAFETGRDLDLMPPADDYKREWGTPGAGTFGATVPLTPLGAVVALLHSARLRERLKRAYLAVRRAVRAGAAVRIGRAGRSAAHILDRGRRARLRHRHAEENHP